MPTIELTDDQYAYIRGLIPVAEAVIDEEVLAYAAFQIILERGFSAAIADAIVPAGEAVNTAALLQLALRHPIEVGGFIADLVALGDDIKRRIRPRRIGF